MASPNPSGSKELQPKVVQKLVVRTLIFVLALGALMYGIRWYRDNRQDMSAGETADTAGWICAVQYNDDGQEVVAIKPDLTIQHVSGWHAGATDRDAVWEPAGNFLFFVSDRLQNTFHVFRWNPTKTEALQRTIGARGRSNPSFPLHGDPNSQDMLLTSGGNVMNFDPIQQQQTQVLPPTPKEITTKEGDEGGGAQSQFSAMYSSIGDSFRIARYCGGDDCIAAIMKRDDGEILIIQNLAQKNGQFDPPTPIAAGEHIDMDINPKNGHVLFAVMGFQFPGPPPPEMIKNGKAIKPFRHYIADFDPKLMGQIIIAASPDDKAAFSSVAVRPDGQSFVAVAGPYQDMNVVHRVLLSGPIKANAGSELKAIMQGEIFEPSWNPAGDKLAYAKRDTDGKRSIFTAHADGSSERNNSGGKGNFGFPKFSPQAVTAN
jgi:hypothetical protein